MHGRVGKIEIITEHPRHAEIQRRKRSILALQRWVKQSPHKLKHNDTQRGNFLVCIMALRADYQEHRDLCCCSRFPSQGCNLHIILEINAINIIEMAAKHFPAVKDNRPKPEERMKNSPGVSIWFLYEA